MAEKVNSNQKEEKLKRGIRKTLCRVEQLTQTARYQLIGC